MRERARASTCSYNLVYNFLIYLLPLKSSVFVVHFLNAFWHGNETFPTGSSQNEIFPLLVVFHLLYSKYQGVKICFYQCRYQNQKFSLVSHSCRSCSTCVALMSHSCRQCRTRVAFVSLVFGTLVVNQTRSLVYTEYVWKALFLLSRNRFYRNSRSYSEITSVQINRLYINHDINTISLNEYC